VKGSIAMQSEAAGNILPGAPPTRLPGQARARAKRSEIQGDGPHQKPFSGCAPRGGERSSAKPLRPANLSPRSSWPRSSTPTPDEQIHRRTKARARKEERLQTVAPAGRRKTGTERQRGAPHALPPIPADPHSRNIP